MSNSSGRHTGGKKQWLQFPRSALFGIQHAIIATVWLKHMSFRDIKFSQGLTAVIVIT